MPKCEIVIARSEDIEPAEFTFNLTENLFPPIFEGNSRVANTLFGWAIATNLKCRENDVTMFFNEEDEVILPKGYSLRTRKVK